MRWSEIRMGNTNLSYTTPYISALLAGITMSTSMTYLPLYAYSLGAKEIEVGLIAGAHSILYIIMPILLGPFLDRTGPKRTVLYGSTILCTLYISYLFIVEPMWFIPLKALEGLGWAFVWPSFQSFFGESGKKLKIYNIMWSLGVVLAPYTGGVIAQMSELKNIFAATGLFMACLIALTFLYPKIQKRQVGKNDPLPNRGSKIGKKELSLLLFAFMFSFTTLIINTFFPIYTTSKGISVIEAGYILTISNVGRILSFILPFSLLRLFSKDRYLQLTILAATLATASIVFYSEVFLYLELFALGLFSGLLYTPIQYRILNIDENRKGYYAGILESTFGVGFLLGPILGGFIAAISLGNAFFLPLAFAIPIILFAVFVGTK